MERLTKQFKIDCRGRVSMELEEGDLWVLGANGAGHSHLCRWAQILTPTSGEVKLDGHSNMRWGRLSGICWDIFLQGIQLFSQFYHKDFMLLLIAAVKVWKPSYIRGQRSFWNTNLSEDADREKYFLFSGA